MAAAAAISRRRPIRAARKPINLRQFRAALAKTLIKFNYICLCAGIVSAQRGATCERLMSFFASGSWSPFGRRAFRLPPNGRRATATDCAELASSRRRRRPLPAIQSATRPRVFGKSEIEISPSSGGIKLAATQAQTCRAKCSGCTCLLGRSARASLMAFVARCSLSRRRSRRLLLSRCTRTQTELMM